MEGIVYMTITKQQYDALISIAGNLKVTMLTRQNARTLMAKLSTRLSTKLKKNRTRT
jgi:ADP-heptose:LPS heptosyltransferase